MDPRTRALDILRNSLRQEASARKAFIDAECGGDPAVRAAMNGILETVTVLDAKEIERTLAEGGRGGPQSSEIGDVPGFRLVRHLGRGGFGSVYEAEDLTLHRRVALKVLLGAADLDRDRREAFLHEARALARISHPNVLLVHSVLEVSGRIGIVTELVEGESLDDVVERAGPLGAEEACQVGIQVCRALSSVHAAGLVHRDVKPGNILRERGGRIVLCDFGLGAFLGRKGRGEIAGTPLYMAPEQVEDRPLDPRSDLYALGTVLYWLVSKESPFRPVRTAEELFGEKLSGRVLPLRDRRPDLPGGFVEIVHRALERDPARRPDSAGAMERGLLRCLEGAEPDAAMVAHGDTGVEVGARRRWPARRAITVLAAVLLASGLAGSAWTLLSRPTSPVREASWWRDRPLGPERLEAGATIGEDDDLFLRLRAEGALSAYVIGQDGAGTLRLLFPTPRSDLKNPLAGGTIHTLPGIDGSGRILRFKVEARGGTESIFLLTRETRIDELEALALAGERPREELTANLRGALLRGLGVGTKDFRPETDGKKLLADIVEALTRSREGGAEGPWLLTWTFRNP